MANETGRILKALTDEWPWLNDISMFHPDSPPQAWDKVEKDGFESPIANEEGKKLKKFQFVLLPPFINPMLNVEKGENDREDLRYIKSELYTAE